jgi:ABC-type multidrug transport system fused ATPase/permease subunit
MGFFDKRDNASGVLSTLMAEECTKINLILSNSISPIATGVSALIVAIIIGYTLQWQMAIAGTILFPFIIGSLYIQTKTTTGGIAKSEEVMKEANLLLGDSISNFKTVQSFGHEDIVVGMFRDLMGPAQTSLFWSNLATGVVFGFS